MQGLSKNEPTVYSDLVARRAVTVMSVCIVLFAAVYGLAVWTPAGQQFEDAVLDGAAAIAGTPQEAIATKALARISGVSVAVALVAVVAIGLIRRRARLAVAGTSILVGAIVTTEIMQLLLGRPILLEYGLRREDQSFPSGHTTVAMATVCGLALVVPYRARGAVVFLSSSWAAFVAVATVTANWHRPSDTIGSALIVLCFAATAVAVLSKGGRVQPGAPRTGRGRLAQRVHLYGTALVASAAWVAATSW